MTVLDTAMGYGDSEARLGEIGVDDWKVVSKLPEFPDMENIATWIVNAVKSSLEKLKVEPLYVLLLRRPTQLRGDKGLEIYAALQCLKAEGLVQKTGVSIYGPSELEGIFAVGEFDLVQFSLSVLDRRLITSGWLAKLADLELAEMTHLITEPARAWQSLGALNYWSNEAEKKSLRYHRSPYVALDIKAGEEFTPESVWAIRPGLGLSPKYLEILTGKTLNQDVALGAPSRWDFLK